MRAALAAAAAAAGAAALIVAAGGIRLEVTLLAAVAAIAFADLTRRACREPVSARNDPTDLATSLGFLAVLVAAAFDAGHAAGGGRAGWTARAAGLALIGAGLVLRAQAARALGASFAVRLGVQDEQALVDSGPYRWIRHPNYAALVLVAVGTALSMSSPLAFAAALCLWLPAVLLRISREERMMIERFDQPYRAYMSRTWRLIVGLY